MPVWISISPRYETRDQRLRKSTQLLTNLVPITFQLVKGRGKWSRSFLSVSAESLAKWSRLINSRLASKLSIFSDRQEEFCLPSFHFQQLHSGS